MENHESSMPGEPGDHSEVRTHAPTLLGADQPGEQGEARVWAPSPWRRRARLTSLAGSAIVLIIWCWFNRMPIGSLPGGILHPVFNGIILAELVLAAIILCYLWLQLRRPRYITTDNAGIGIGGLKGGRALRWSEIRSARSVHYAKIALQTDNGPLKISLHAYTEGLAEDLFALIVNRANLYRSPDDVYRFLPEDQIRERFLARGQNAVLERPPMPASRRFTNDTVAKRTFILAAAMMIVYVIGGIGLGFWLHRTFGNLNFIMHHNFKYRRHNPGNDAMFRLLDQLRGRTDQSDSDNDTPNGTATIWLNQPPGAPLAAPDVSGHRIQWTAATWAPAEMKGAPSSLYRYDVSFLPAKGQKSWPMHFAASLAYASRRTVYRMHNEFPNIETSADDRHFFINSESSELKESGPVIGSLPSPRSWRYVGVSAFSNREISGFEFEPAPASEDFEPADGKLPAGAVAAWLPGRFAGNQLNCNVIYRDGGVRHLVLSPGVHVKGIKVLWKMPAKLEKDLTKGPI